MDWWQAIFLAFVQGITEFLPISSSGHLVLAPNVLGWDDQGLSFDVAVHVGSMLAIVGYFRDDFRALFHAVNNRHLDESSIHLGLIIWLAVATIPAGIVAITLGDIIGTALRNPRSVAIALIFFGLVLWWADRSSQRTREVSDMNWRDALLIGCAQAIALIPGTSRSGITITTGLILGLTREAAARFSFLMAVPVICLAGGWKTVELVRSAEQVDWVAMVIGLIASMITAYACIHWFLKYLRRFSLLPFVIYRVVLGVVLLVVIF